MKKNNFLENVDVLLSSIDNNIDKKTNWIYQLEYKGITLKLEFHSFIGNSEEFLMFFILKYKEGAFGNNCKEIKYNEALVIRSIEITSGLLEIKEVKRIINLILRDIQNKNLSNFIDIS